MGLALLKQTPPLQPEHHPERITDRPSSLMTPARRAALDALEREFHELLVLGILRDAGR